MASNITTNTMKTEGTLSMDPQVLYECSICKLVDADENYILHHHKCGQNNNPETTQDSKGIDSQVVVVYEEPTSPPEYGSEDDGTEDYKLTRDYNCEGSVWTHKETSLLLNLYQQLKSDFNNPRVKKYKIWRRIGRVLKKPPEVCDKKFRNLKTRYRVIKNNREHVESKKKWDYFDQMDELLSDDPSMDSTCSVDSLSQDQDDTLEVSDDAEKDTRPRVIAAYSEPLSPIEYVSEDDSFETSKCKRGYSCSGTRNVWSHTEVPVLLDLYRQNKALFTNPRVKKLELWRKIGNILNKPPELCDKKFRDLKTRYRILKDHYNEGGYTRKRWEYFDVMHELLSDDPGADSLHNIPSLPQGTLSQNITSPSTSKRVNALTLEEVKLRRNKLQDSPEWFKDIWLDQTTRLERISKQQQNILDIQKEMIEVQKVRNSLLQDINILLSKNNT